ncbi:MFS transporter [Anaerobacillus alkalidiazotrophicus]|uniref:MFS transporter n=1 Tax=Anaerobacillus alkalidiazotrophicus TaxID=472963 RepID=A0A1S2MAB3_9BACI|nr:OFA family MFS transporter [Anaerobacillus alkalidiazotrophicus]OIJ21443.1 MFS transporter [Anaerobacillus alkalidiazotrophicus]
MKRWLVVIGAILIQINLGAVYAWSLFNQPLIETYGWDREDIVVTFSITIFMLAACAFIAGKIQDKIGPRWVATIGGILLGLGVMLASQATTIYQLYLFYGIIGGAGIGITYVCPLSACVKWFPDKRGLISGVAVAGFGLGGLVYKPIILFLIDNFGVSSAFLYLGIIYFVLVVLGAQLLSNPEAGDELNSHQSDGEALTVVSEQFSPKEMLGTYQFYLLWFMYLFGTMAGLLVISFAVDIGLELVKLDVVTASNAVMVIALFNAGGRIILGKISDNIGRINTLILMYGITTLIMLYMSFGTMNNLTFLISVSLIGFCFGGFLALFPSITADFYGTKNIGANYGIMYLAYGISAFVGPIIIKYISFSSAFLLAAFISLIAIILAKVIVTPKLQTVVDFSNEPLEKVN